MSNLREAIKDKKRIVVKIGSSSLQHPETRGLDYIRMEKLVRELCDIHNQGKDVVLVSSGAIAVGKRVIRLKEDVKRTAAEEMAVKQACSAIGQARLMMTYQMLFAEYFNTALIFPVFSIVLHKLDVQMSLLAVCLKKKRGRFSFLLPYPLLAAIPRIKARFNKKGRPKAVRRRAL